MKTAYIILALFLISTGIGSAQNRKGTVNPAMIPVPQAHSISEYTFDVPSDSMEWAGLSPGLHAGFGSTDALYLRCEVPHMQGESLSWKGTAWKGERVNAQVLVWANLPVEQIRVRVSDLVGAEGHMITAGNIITHMVRYVVSGHPYDAVAPDCQSRFDSAWLMPDRFEPFERFDLPRNTVRPVWIAFNIPPDAQSGAYHGTIEVISSAGRTNLSVDLTVQGLTLPKPSDWGFRLDLWQNPWVIAEYFNVAPWSEEHRILLKKHLKMYAEAGGSYITTYAVYSPWSDNSYRLEGTMIDWIKTADGGWKFDYSIFDQYVNLAMEAGITKAITIYTPIPWGNRFRFLDEKTGNFTYAEWIPGSAEFREIWGAFLTDLKNHLQQKGWLSRTYLGINENTLEQTLAAIRVIREHSPDWKITYAGDWHQELATLLDDYSTVLGHEPSLPELAKRAVNKMTTTFYVCCTPPKPNNFVFSPPVEGRYLGWYAMACGYDGFLRWAYDAWVADPERDARHTLWPAGDCYLVYPGANSSIRFEKLREGIQDYEKIRMLRAAVDQSGNKEAMHLMKQLEDHLKAFGDDADYSKRDYSLNRISGLVDRGTRLIEEISRMMKPHPEGWGR